ncbi:MAG: hypothetical protein ACRDWI_10275 [Jiangellaceae bacterium]
MLALPRSARLAAWAAGWLAGEVSLGDVVARVQGDDEPHLVKDVPARSEPTSLATALGDARANGARAMLVALPRPGDPNGLAGPGELTVAAVQAGEAVLALGAPCALVPSVQTFGPPGDQGHLVTWTWHDAVPPHAWPSRADAERELSEAMITAGLALANLDVASWRPEVAQLLDDLRSDQTGEPLPRMFPPPAQALAARAARVLAVVSVALDDDGGALTAAATRRAALLPLERAARHALAAACNVLAEVPPPLA